MTRHKRKTRFHLILVLATGAFGQNLQGPDFPTPAQGVLQRLTLDSTRRQELEAVLARRDYVAAEELLAEEAKRDPQSQAVLLALANVLFLDSKHLNCAVVLKKAEKLAPLDERSHLLLALSYVTIGRLSWARTELEKLSRDQPNNATYPYWLARIAYRKSDPSTALVHAQRAIQLNPKFMKAHDQLGLCYDALGNSDEAVNAFEEAIRLDAELPVRSPWPSTNLGILLLRQGFLTEAETRFRDSIRIDPRFPIAHFRLGQTLEKKQSQDEAIAELEYSAKLDPTYPDPHYALGRIYRQRSEAKKAEKEFSVFQALRKKERPEGARSADLQ